MTPKNNLFQIFTDFLMYAYFGAHRVRIPVFDNYQTCPVALNPFHFVLTVDGVDVKTEDGMQCEEFLV